MSREVHVQFCERVGVQLPCATHLVILTSRKTEEIMEWLTRLLEGRMGLVINQQKTGNTKCQD